jgi:hypothetical protein
VVAITAVLIWSYFALSNNQPSVLQWVW